MTNDKLKAITELFANEAFMNELSSVSEEKDIILLAKKYGVEITEQEINDLFTVKPETKKWAKEVADCAKQLALLCGIQQQRNHGAFRRRARLCCRWNHALGCL